MSRNTLKDPTLTRYSTESWVFLLLCRVTCSESSVIAVEYAYVFQDALPTCYTCTVLSVLHSQYHWLGYIKLFEINNFHGICISVFQCALLSDFFLFCKQMLIILCAAEVFEIQGSKLALGEQHSLYCSSILSSVKKGMDLPEYPVG